MIEFKEGARVLVNDVYPKGATTIDQSILDIRGSEGVMVRDTGEYIEVEVRVTESKTWTDTYLFFPEELTLMEEAHPL